MTTKEESSNGITKPYIRTILIDGDILAYVCSSAVQKDIDWGDGLWTCHAYLNEAVDYLDVLQNQIFDSLRMKVELDPDVGIYYCFSDKNNFRKGINPEYKANRRNNRKPTCYYALVEHIEKNNSSISFENLEGDDVISMFVTGSKVPTLIISKDKDFKTVPKAYFYDINKDTVTYYDTETAYRNLLIQTLTGDIADNYRGCPKVGKVNAEKIIQGEPNVLKLWDLVVQTFESKGSTKEEALLNYNMAYLLHAKDFDKETKTKKDNGLIDPSYGVFAM